MAIKMQMSEPLVTVSYKLPHQLKKEIEKIAKREKMSQGEIVRSFLEHAKKEYEAGKVDREWSEEALEQLREKIIVGDSVIASGMIGRVKKIHARHGSVPKLFELEILNGAGVTVIENVITDILPSKSPERTKAIWAEISKQRRKWPTVR